MDTAITKPKTGPKDFFLYLSAMAALYVSVGSLIRLLFGIIDFTNPDRLDYYGTFYTGGIRFAIASLIIIFPVYLIVSYVLRTSVVREPARSELWVRKWFIYITLFVAAGIVIGNLVAVVNTFLGGELTARFALKVLSMVVIAAAVFGYYYYDLKRASRGEGGTQPLFIGAAVVAVVAAIVGGFLVAGSPATQRDLRFDEQRIGDLQNLQWQVVEYWRAKDVLPAELSLLEDPLRGVRAPKDPQSDEPYGYMVLRPLTFELCATFERESTDNYGPEFARPKEFADGIGDVSWAHSSGEQCFERTIDPDFFPEPIVR